MWETKYYFLLSGLEASRGGLNERLASTGLASTVGSGGGPGSVTGPGVGGSSLVSDHLSELQRIITSHKVCKKTVVILIRGSQRLFNLTPSLFIEWTQFYKQKLGEGVGNGA